MFFCRLVTCDIGIFVDEPSFASKAVWRPVTLTIGREISAITSCFPDRDVCKLVNCDIGIFSIFPT